MKMKFMITMAIAGAMSASLYAGTMNTPAYGPGMMNCPNMPMRGMMQGQGMQSRGMMMQGQGMMNCPNMQMRGMMRGNSPMMGMHNARGMRMFAGLNLNNEQRYKLSILRDEMRLNMKKMMGYNRQGKMAAFISDKGFDKQAFEKYADNMHKHMLKIKADYMEKAFKILTKEQISELKSNLTK
ncbi:MAG: Spy/CpxP family protein refolding chaperone [Sulfurospirillaceae bacterium]|nr:Spy/CpxP family protein refolding chaperone [Sulfurospirillaceae bacterium]